MAKHKLAEGKGQGEGGSGDSEDKKKVGHFQHSPLPELGSAGYAGWFPRLLR